MGADIVIAWWPYEINVPAPPLPPERVFRTWPLAYSEATRHRGRVRIIVPESDALRVPTGDWDLRGIVFVNP